MPDRRLWQTTRRVQACVDSAARCPNLNPSYPSSGLLLLPGGSRVDGDRIGVGESMFFFFWGWWWWYSI